MLPAISSLLILQERDARVAQLQDDLTRIPLEEKASEAKEQAAQSRLEQGKGEARQVEVERKKLDLDVQAKQLQIGKYRSQQLQTRKNEEFQALNHEIEHAQREIVRVEDDELRLMERGAELESLLTREQAELKKLEAVWQSQRQELAARKMAAAEELTRALAQQKEAEAQVEEVLLKRYRRILVSKKHHAVVAIQQGSCGGCHMKMTPQTVIKARGEQEIVACDNCGRLIYCDD